MKGEVQRMLQARQEIADCLSNRIIPFWLSRSIDHEYGGYITNFDAEGNYTGYGTKYLVTQSRMVWGFSNLRAFARPEDRERVDEAARHGARFLMDAFWDSDFEGYYWQLNRDGSVADPSKLVYGEGFAIYALAEFALVHGDVRAREFAEKGFDLLQKYAVDSLYGGYYENIERDWSISPAGPYAGDRKSLDIHMHLLEAFTTLARLTDLDVHKRKLKEVLDLIFLHMINAEKGYGFNQFDVRFNQIPAINIKRTWNAERETNEVIETPTNTTSYGHNVELSWLADLALKVLQCDRMAYEPTLRRLLDHALSFGYDYQYGGVYRDGIADQSVLVYDKEWWQNFEAMTGFLNGYVLYGDERYFEAFLQTWAFDRDRFMNMAVGESRQLLLRDGTPIVSNLGNPWKGIYHTGRALAESVRRLDLLLAESH